MCAAGTYKVVWNLTDDNNKKIPPGIYRCYLIFGDYECHGDIWVKK